MIHIDIVVARIDVGVQMAPLPPLKRHALLHGGGQAGSAGRRLLSEECEALLPVAGLAFVSAIFQVLHPLAGSEVQNFKMTVEWLHPGMHFLLWCAPTSCCIVIK